MNRPILTAGMCLVAVAAVLLQTIAPASAAERSLGAKLRQATVLIPVSDSKTTPTGFVHPGIEVAVMKPMTRRLRTRMP